MVASRNRETDDALRMTTIDTIFITPIEQIISSVLAHKKYVFSSFKIFRVCECNGYLLNFFRTMKSIKNNKRVCIVY